MLAKAAEVELGTSGQSQRKRPRLTDSGAIERQKAITDFRSSLSVQISQLQDENPLLLDTTMMKWHCPTATCIATFDTELQRDLHFANSCSDRSEAEFCITCGRDVSSAGEVLQKHHKDSHESVSNDGPCAVCQLDLGFLTEPQRARHRKVCKANAKPGTPQCSGCRAPVADLKHRDTCLAKAISDTREAMRMLLSTTRCRTCMLECKTWLELRVHRKGCIETSAGQFCPNCTMGPYPDDAAIVLHLKTCPFRWRCPPCGRILSSQDALVGHANKFDHELHQKGTKMDDEHFVMRGLGPAV